MRKDLHVVDQPKAPSTKEGIWCPWYPPWNCSPKKFMLLKALSRNNFRLMWALIPVKATAEAFTLHLENLSNCQVSSNPQAPKKLVSKLCDCSFSFSFFFFSFVGHSKNFSDGLRSSTSCWVSGQKKMERSQAHAAQQEAAKGARGVESRGNFLNRGQFFLRADNAPDLRVSTLSRFLRVGKEVGTSSSSNPLGFRRGPCIMRSSRLPCSSTRISCLLFQSNN
jgi:hypothetical protein